MEIVLFLVTAGLLEAFDLNSPCPEQQVLPVLQSLSNVSLQLMLQSMKTSPGFCLTLWPLAERVPGLSTSAAPSCLPGSPHSGPPHRVCPGLQLRRGYSVPETPPSAGNFSLGGPWTRKIILCKRRCLWELAVTEEHSKLSWCKFCLFCAVFMLHSTFFFLPPLPSSASCL